MIKKSSIKAQRNDICHFFPNKVNGDILLQKIWLYNLLMLPDKKPKNQSEFRSKKKIIGLLYGLASGLFFAIFAWGIDAYLLASANASYFWIKFVPGMLISAIAGSIAGYLTIHFGKHGIAFLLWGLLAIVLTFLAIWLPASGTEFFIRLLNPDFARWINFSEIDSIEQFRLVGFMTIGLASIISGLLEINLVEQVMLSSYNSSIVTMILTCLVIFGIAGSASDYLINIHFREPVQALDRVLQTVVEYGDQEIPREVAREIHLSAFNQLNIDLFAPRRLSLIAFDQTLGNMTVLVDFQGTLIQCTMIYSQLSNCSLARDT